MTSFLYWNWKYKASNFQKLSTCAAEANDERRGGDDTVMKGVIDRVSERKRMRETSRGTCT